MIGQLHKFNVDKDDIERLKAFEPRFRFELIDDNVFSDIVEGCKDWTVFKDLIPIMADGDSNYWCLYIAGAMKGMVCHLQHDMINLEPKFKNVSNFISAIETHIKDDIWDFYEIDNDIFDFPSKKDLSQFTERKKIIDCLSTELKTETDEERRQHLSFSIMVLTSIDEIEANIYPFLYSDDVCIQERAIYILGFHKYKLAIEILTDLETTAMPPGPSVAKTALKITFRNILSKNNGVRANGT